MCVKKGIEGSGILGRCSCIYESQMCQVCHDAGRSGCKAMTQMHEYALTIGMITPEKDAFDLELK